MQETTSEQAQKLQYLKSNIMQEITLAQAQELIADGKKVWMRNTDFGISVLWGDPQAGEWKQVTSVTEKPEWFSEDGESREAETCAPIFDSAWEIGFSDGTTYPVITEIGWWVIGGAIYAGNILVDLMERLLAQDENAGYEVLQQQLENLIGRKLTFEDGLSMGMCISSAATAALKVIGVTAD